MNMKYRGLIALLIGVDLLVQPAKFYHSVGHDVGLTAVSVAEARQRGSSGGRNDARGGRREARGDRHDAHESGRNSQEQKKKKKSAKRQTSENSVPTTTEPPAPEPAPGLEDAPNNWYDEKTIPVSACGIDQAPEGLIC